jgi:hypothetical protein
MVHYTGQEHWVRRYCFHRGQLDHGEPRCIAFGGIPVDNAVGREVVRVVRPAAVEAAVLAAQQAGLHRDEVLAALERDREAAHYEMQRAWKQYDAVDPENRLVAGELERAGTKPCCVSMPSRNESSNTAATASSLSRQPSMNSRTWRRS